MSIPECDDITSPNFQLDSHLHFKSNIWLLPFYFSQNSPIWVLDINYNL